MTGNATLDAGQTGCGDLIMMVFQTMKWMLPGQTLEFVVYNLAAAVDIPAWCRSMGTTLLRADTDVHPKRFLLRKEK